MKIFTSVYFAGAVVGIIASYFFVETMTLKSTLIAAALGAVFGFYSKRGNEKNEDGIKRKNLATCLWCRSEFKKRPLHSNRFCSNKCENEAKKTKKFRG